MSAEFLVTALIVCLIPGTGVIYTLAVALGGGFRAALLASVGCTLAVALHIAASLAGLAAILHASATLYEVLRILGVLYLLYMAVMVLRAKGSLALTPRRERVSDARLIRDGVLLNILNPKLTMFFVAFLPQFVPADAARPTETMLLLAGVFMALTFATFVLYGAFAAASRAFLNRPAVMTWMRRSFAAAFGLLGLRLALADR